MNTFHYLAFKSSNWLLNRKGPVWQETSAAEKQQQFVTLLFLATSVVLLIWLISRVHNRLTVPQKPRRPYQLFRRLLKHHGLGASDRSLLLIVATCLRLKQPTLLLLSPVLYARHAEAWLSRSMFAPLWPKARERLVRIGQQVFAEEPVPRV